MLKRYLLFYGDAYYPSGGWNDFHGSFDTIEEALKAILIPSWKPDWYQIIDLQTLEEVT